MITGPPRVLGRIDHHLDPLFLVILEKEIPAGRPEHHRPDEHRGHGFLREPGQDQGAEKNRQETHGRSEIRLQENQPHGDSDQSRAQGDHASRGVGRPVFREDPGQHQQDGDFGQLRRLPSHEGDPDPAAGAGDRPPEKEQAGHEEEKQGIDIRSKGHPGLVIDGDRQKEDDQSGGHPKKLLPGVSAAAVGRGAVDQKDPGESVRDHQGREHPVNFLELNAVDHGLIYKEKTISRRSARPSPLPRPRIRRER